MERGKDVDMGIQNCRCEFLITKHVYIVLIYFSTLFMFLFLILQKVRLNALRVRYCHEILTNKENKEKNALLKRVEAFCEVEAENAPVVGPSS